jgi:hypothetical protein
MKKLELEINDIFHDATNIYFPQPQEEAEFLANNIFKDLDIPHMIHSALKDLDHAKIKASRKIQIYMTFKISKRTEEVFDYYHSGICGGYNSDVNYLYCDSVHHDYTKTMSKNYAILYNTIKLYLIDDMFPKETSIISARILESGIVYESYDPILRVKMELTLK